MSVIWYHFVVVNCYCCCTLVVGLTIVIVVGVSICLLFGVQYFTGRQSSSFFQVH